MKTSDEMTEIVFRKMAIHELKMKERRRKILKTAVPLMLILVFSFFSFLLSNTKNDIDIVNSLIDIHIDKKTEVFNISSITHSIVFESNKSVSFELDKMISNSEYIVLAKYEHTNSKNDFDNEIVGIFTIDDVLKGEIEEKYIVLKQTAMNTYFFDNKIINISNPLLATFKVDNNYILFLNKDIHNNFIPADDLFALYLSDSNILTLVCNISANNRSEQIAKASDNNYYHIIHNYYNFKDDISDKSLINLLEFLQKGI